MQIYTNILVPLLVTFKELFYRFCVFFFINLVNFVNSVSTFTEKKTCTLPGTTGNKLFTKHQIYLRALIPQNCNFFSLKWHVTFTSMQLFYTVYFGFSFPEEK